jgi:hypothetical protein
MTFKLRRSVGGVEPEAVVSALDKIYKTHNEITPPRIIEAAKPKTSTLHPAFEWDDKIAGHEHRLWQARQIVRAVVAVDDDTQQETPHYVHVTVAHQPEGQYHPASVVLADVDLFARALAELRGKLNAIQTSISTLEDMARETGDSERLMRVALAVKALENAGAALASIH